MQVDDSYLFFLNRDVSQTERVGWNLASRLRGSLALTTLGGDSVDRAGEKSLGSEEAPG